MIIQGDLILVLMEDALRGNAFSLQMIPMDRLNPCSNGRCSASIPRRETGSGTEVLILVLMKDALRVCKELRRRINGYVLILVLMEDVLRVVQ